MIKIDKEGVSIGVSTNNGTMNTTNSGDVTSNNQNQIVIVNNNGIGYEAVKTICNDIVKDELMKYADDAKSLANKRQEELMNSILEKLQDERISNENILKEFKNPDMQYCYFEAQKAFIRRGTDELELILSNLIVHRVKESKNSLLQIVLNQAVEVSNLLLPQQYDILSLAFFMINCGIQNVDSFAKLTDIIKSYLIPFIKDLTKKASVYKHIEFSKCGSISIGENKLEKLFSNKFRTLFLKGKSRDELTNEFNLGVVLDKYPGVFKRSPYDENLLQVSAMDEEELEKSIKMLEADEDIDNQVGGWLRNLFQMQGLSDEEVKNKVISLVPEINPLFDVWNDSYLKHMNLTSVGMVLGAVNLMNKSGVNLDLNIWI